MNRDHLIQIISEAYDPAPELKGRTRPGTASERAADAILKAMMIQAKPPRKKPNLATLAATIKSLSPEDRLTLYQLLPFPIIEELVDYFCKHYDDDTPVKTQGGAKYNKAIKSQAILISSKKQQAKKG